MALEVFFNVLPVYNLGFISEKSYTLCTQNKVLQHNTVYPFQNKSIDFSLIRYQYLLVTLLRLLWFLLISPALLLCGRQFGFTALLNHLCQANSPRADQPNQQ